MIKNASNGRMNLVSQTEIKQPKEAVQNGRFQFIAVPLDIDGCLFGLFSAMLRCRPCLTRVGRRPPPCLTEKILANPNAYAKRNCYITHTMEMPVPHSVYTKVPKKSDVR